MSTTPAPRRRDCTRCGKKHLGAFVWLELETWSGLYFEPGRVTPEASQGLFPFGAKCAKIAIGEGRYQRVKPQ